MPEHSVRLTASHTVATVEAHLKLLFDLPASSQLLLWDTVDVDGGQRKESIDLHCLVHGVSEYFKNGRDPEELQTSGVVLVASKETVSTPAVKPTVTDSNGDSNGSIRSSKSDRGSDKTREHKPWVQLLDQLWPCHIPRYSAY